MYLVAYFSCQVRSEHLLGIVGSYSIIQELTCWSGSRPEMSITDTGASMFLMSHHLTAPSSLLVIISVPVLEAVHMLQYTGSR